MESEWLHCLFQGAFLSLSSFLSLHASTNQHDQPQLETDDDILIPKASAALERYGHQLVIANSLHKRKHQVALVEPEGVVRWIKLQPEETREIEEDIVRVLRQRHGEWIQNRTTDTHS